MATAGLPVAPGWNMSGGADNVTTIALCNFNITYDPYIAPLFGATRRLERTNEFAIRLGASNDMITLLEGTPEQERDYLKGLMMTSVVFLCTFVVCVVVLCVFRETGYRRAGFLCGRFVRPQKPEGYVESLPSSSSGKQQQSRIDDTGGSTNNDVIVLSSSEGEAEVTACKIGENEQPVAASADGGDQPTEAPIPDEPTEKLDQGKDDATTDDAKKEEIEKWELLVARQEKRLFRARIVLAVSLVTIVVTCIMFCVTGHVYLNDAFKSVNGGLKSAQRLTLEGIALSEKYLSQVEKIRSETFDRLESLDPIDFCPGNVTGVPNATYCNPVPDCDFDFLPPEVQEDLEELIDQVFDFTSGLTGFVHDLKDDLENIYSSIGSYLVNEETLEKVFWASYAFTVALGLTCMQMLIGLFFIHKQRVGPVIRWVREQLLYGIFVNCMVVAVALATAFLAGAIGTSDWCINSPDPKTTWVLSDQQHKLTSAGYQLMRYYVNACSPDEEPVELRQQFEALLGVVQSVANLLASIAEMGQRKAPLVCDGEIKLMELILGALEALACTAGEALVDADEFFWCQNFNPIYVDLMYSGVCDEAQSGLGWVAGCMVAIAFFSIVVLLLRAAAYDIEDEEEYWHSTFLRRLHHRISSWLRNRNEGGETKSCLACFKRRKEPTPHFAGDEADDIVIEA
mmetsp:Transcript_24002/g.66631  ORF Transcript_24002/g.66631 Transcript_24002/m.66631 type:complete len:683 (-) Transcript_24002:923-2971(-)